MRLLLALLLVGVSVASIAAPTEHFIGPYDSYSSAQAACLSHRSGSESGDNWSVGYCGSVSGEYNGFQYVVDPDGYSNSKQYYTFYYLATCPSGTTANPETGFCEEPSNPCDDTDLEGDVWDSQTESCNCPAGTTDVFGSDASYVCRPELPECTPDSPGFTGYANDQPVCNFDDQCSSGESGGFVNGQWVCLPDACDGGTYVNGACISPDDTDDQPGSEHGDDDTDGDGTPNSEDDDADGDGTPNNEDPTPQDEGSASAEGGCGKPPVCSGGDPQQCAILKQQWYSMCYAEDYQSGENGFYAPESGQGLGDRVSDSFQGFKGDLQNSEVLSGVTGFFTVSVGGACPTYHVSLEWVNLDFDHWCSDIMPWSLIQMTLMAVTLIGCVVIMIGR